MRTLRTNKNKTFFERGRMLHCLSPESKVSFRWFARFTVFAVFASNVWTEYFPTRGNYRCFCFDRNMKKYHEYHKYSEYIGSKNIFSIYPDIFYIPNIVYYFTVAKHWRTTLTCRYLQCQRNDQFGMSKCVRNRNIKISAAENINIPTT